MKRLIIACAFVIALVLPIVLTADTDKPVNAEGTIYFRDGSVVQVDYFGFLDRPVSFRITGKSDGNSIDLAGTEVNKIAFLNASAHYAYGGDGEIQLVNRQGERFMVSHAAIQPAGGAGGMVQYVYTDPITKKRKETYATPDKIQEIIIGPSAGRLKVNPVTKERFPDFFMFDPYNGTRLVWADDPNSIDIKAEGPIECRAIVVRKRPTEGRFVVPNVNLKLSYEAKAEGVVNVNTDGTGSAVFQIKPGVYNAELTVGTSRRTQKVVIGSDGLLLIEISDK